MIEIDEIIQTNRDKQLDEYWRKEHDAWGGRYKTTRIRMKT